MERVTDEILLKIFGYLGIRSLTNCKMVCKRWKMWASKVKLEQLVIRNYRLEDSQFYDGKWLSTDEPIDLDDVTNIFSLGRFDLIPFQLDRLKRLIVYLRFGNLTSDQISIVTLNKLTRLEHLQLMNDGWYAEKTSQKLSLPILRVLHIKARRDVSLTLNTPKLEVLACESGPFPEILYEGTMKQLILDTPQFADFLSENLDGFTSLEILKISFPETFLDGILGVLPSLKEVHVFEDRNKLFVFEDTKWLMNQMIEKNGRLEKKVKIYFMGHLLDNHKRFEDYGFLQTYRKLFYFRN